MAIDLLARQSSYGRFQMSSFSKQLNKLIPGGAHTYSRGDDQFPVTAPEILTRGEGAYVWDPDGRRYLDYGMALRAVTLGYSNKRVNEAAIREIEKGNNLTRASQTELYAAETLVDTIPSADMVKFAKNGSNVTTAAVKIARAYTGRRYVCVPRQHPFFSFDDWFIGVTPIVRGIPEEYVSCTLMFDYGDEASLQALFDQYPDEIAAVMLEPATTEIPCPASCEKDLTCESSCSQCEYRASNFLQIVQRLCNNNGALFILDEMITGFRWHLQGAQTYFGVEPDLSTFGKGMANGFSVAAVVGKAEFMAVGATDTSSVERTFLLSSTHGGEMSSLGAFIETVAIYREENVCEHLWRYGAQLRDGLNNIAREFDLQDYFSVVGPPISLNYVTFDQSCKPSLEFRTLFSQEMARQGVLMPWIAVSFSHRERELELTFAAARESLRIYRKALDHGIDRYLQGPAIKPVFRRYN